MIKIPYVRDPDDRVSVRCYDQSGDGVIVCIRPKGHPRNTVVLVPTGEEGENYEVKFNHRGAKEGEWYTW